MICLKGCRNHIAELKYLNKELEGTCSANKLKSDSLSNQMQLLKKENSDLLGKIVKYEATCTAIDKRFVEQSTGMARLVEELVGKNKEIAGKDDYIKRLRKENDAYRAKNRVPELEPITIDIKAPCEAGMDAEIVAQKTIGLTNCAPSQKFKRLDVDRDVANSRFLSEGRVVETGGSQHTFSRAPQAAIDKKKKK